MSEEEEIRRDIPERERLVRLEERVLHLQKDMAEMKSMFRIVISAVVVAIIAAVVQFIVKGGLA